MIKSKINLKILIKILKITKYLLKKLNKLNKNKYKIFKYQENYQITYRNYLYKYRRKIRFKDIMFT